MQAAVKSFYFSALVLFAHMALASRQVKSLITNNSFCIVHRATAQSKTGTFRDNGVAKAPPGFQAGWSDSMYLFYLFLFILFPRLEFPFMFLYP
jgi:hypothetical protein